MPMPAGSATMAVAVVLSPSAVVSAAGLAKAPEASVATSPSSAAPGAVAKYAMTSTVVLRARRRLDGAGGGTLLLVGAAAAGAALLLVAGATGAAGAGAPALARFAEEGAEVYLERFGTEYDVRWFAPAHFPYTSPELPRTFFEGAPRAPLPAYAAEL